MELSHVTSFYKSCDQVINRNRLISGTSCNQV